MSRADPALGTAHHGHLQVVGPLGQRGAVVLGEAVELDIVEGAHLAAMW